MTENIGLPFLQRCACGQLFEVPLDHAGTVVSCTACNKPCQIPELSRRQISRSTQSPNALPNRPTMTSGFVVSVVALVAICLTAVLILSIEPSRTPRDQWPSDNAAVGLFSMVISAIEFIALLIGGLVACVLAIVGFGLSVTTLRTDKAYSQIGIVLSIVTACATVGLAFYLGFFG